MRWVAICVYSAVLGLLLGLACVWVQRNLISPAQVIQVDEAGDISIMEALE